MADCIDCGKTFEIGDWPFRCKGLGHLPGPCFSGDANIHSSERVIVMHNPRTGETRVPGRVEGPIHPNYAAQGYEYKSIDTFTQLKQLEKDKNLVHERSHYDPGSGRADRDIGGV